MDREKDVYKLIELLEQRISELEKTKLEQVCDAPTWSDSFSKYWDYQIKLAEQDA